MQMNGEQMYDTKMPSHQQGRHTNVLKTYDVAPTNQTNIKQGYPWTLCSGLGGGRQYALYATTREIKATDSELYLFKN